MLAALVLAAMLNGSLLGQNVFIRRAAAPGETFRFYVLNGQVFTESSNNRSWVQNGQIFSETL